MTLPGSPRLVGNPDYVGRPSLPGRPVLPGLRRDGNNPMLFLALGNSLTARDRAGPFSLTGSGALRYAPGSGGRTNYFLNPSAEVDLSTMAGSNGTLARVAGGSQGGFCARLTQTAINGSLVIYSKNIPMITVGTVVRASWDAKLVSGPTGTMKIDWYHKDAATAALGSVQAGPSPLTLTSNWQRFSQTMTISAAGTHGLIMYFRGQGSSDVIDIDGMILEIDTGSNLPYFDGSFPGCQWADSITGVPGTAHASPSISKAAFWIEEATTNLLPNPGAEVNDWYAQGLGAGATVTRDLSYSYIGSASFKVVTTGAGGQEGIALATLPALGYTGTERTFQPSIYVRGSGSLTARITVIYTDATFTEHTGTDFTATDQWVRIAPIALAVNIAKTVDFMRVDVRQQGTSAGTFWVDSGQLEQKAYATSYADGSLGTGYTWAGTAHASASTRAVTNLTFGNEDQRFNINKGALVMLVNRQDAIASGAFPTFINVGEPAAGKDEFSIYSTTSDWKVYSFFTSNSVGIGSVTTNQVTALGVWSTIYSDWSGTVQRTKVDAGTLVTGTVRGAVVGTVDTSADAHIGSRYTGGATLDSFIGPVAIFDRPLTPAELTILAATDPVNWWSALAA